MDSYLALEWHEPRFNFATMSRDLGRWSAKAVCYDAAAHTFSDICDGVLLNLDTRDAFDYFGSGSISAEELDLMKDKIASRTNATAPCQQRKTEVDILKQHLAADKYTAEKLIRAKAEIAASKACLIWLTPTPSPPNNPAYCSSPLLRLSALGLSPRAACAFHSSHCPA